MRRRFQPGGVVAGFRLLRTIAEGAHGSVYLAQDGDQDVPVALKLVPLGVGSASTAARAAFEAAAALSQRLKHPAIVDVLSSGVEDGAGWLAMEYVAGGSLADQAEPGRLLPASRVLLAAERLAQALAHAHRQGVVHRDLKPANVLVDWTGNRIKLADFGLAWASDGQQTGTGLVPGSPAYMAPEQLAGGRPTPRSDIYALGVMVFQLLSGRLPFETHSMGELLRQVAHEPPPALHALRPDLPTALAALVERMLAKRAEQRPADGDDLAAELRTIRQTLEAPG